MSDTLQQVIVAIAVACAAIFLLVRGRGKAGGKSGCNCGSKKSPLE